MSARAKLVHLSPGQRFCFRFIHRISLWQKPDYASRRLRLEKRGGAIVVCSLVSSDWKKLLVLDKLSWRTTRIMPRRSSSSSRGAEEREREKMIGIMLKWHSDGTEAGAACLHPADALRFYPFAG